MVKFQSYLAGTAFALLLGAHVAMELLHAYPVNTHLWHLNIVFAREARPLLHAIDVHAGGGPALTILLLGALALLSVVAGWGGLRLLAAANCHIALIMLAFLGARSYVRTYPYGLPSHDMLMSLGAKLSGVQLGMAAFILILSAACVQSHVAFASGRRQRTRPAMREAVTGNLLHS